jgi:tetratricopeptide (TPR) repeat protein
MPKSRKRGIDALGLLNAYAFINSQDTGINLHRLVHIATRNWLRQNALFSHWIQRAADQIRKVFPDTHYTNRGLWREYLPHALSLAYEDEFTAQWKEYIDLIQHIADCLYKDGRWNEAEVLYTELTRIEQEETGPNNPSALASMAHLALTYWAQGRWGEAEELWLQVLETSKTVQEAEHPDTLTGMNNLAYTWKSQGKLQDALALMEKCSELRNKTLGTDHPDAVTSSHALSDWKEVPNSLPNKDPPWRPVNLSAHTICRKLQQGVQQLRRSLSRPVKRTSSYLMRRYDPPQDHSPEIIPFSWLPEEPQPRWKVRTYKK